MVGNSLDSPILDPFISIHFQVKYIEAGENLAKWKGRGLCPIAASCFDSAHTFQNYESKLPTWTKVIHVYSIGGDRDVR